MFCHQRRKEKKEKESLSDALLLFDIMFNVMWPNENSNPIRWHDPSFQYQQVNAGPIVLTFQTKI
jgi:hypothetical protein